MSKDTGAPVYLSAQSPRWSPRTEEDITNAVAGRLLEESHYLEVKRELPPNNRELARDLASLAIDGGTLLVGLEEDKATGSLRPVPQPLTGLAERVESIARTVPDPALAVLCSSIPSQADPACGYLLVHVPPSGLAPHMVDHRYLGRGDKTKQYLSDPEVRRLHERRRASELDGLRLLQKYLNRDPVPVELRRQAHLFLLAEPVAGRPGMLLGLVHGQGAQQRLHQLVQSAAEAPEIGQALPGFGGFSPSLSYASSFALRSSGTALTSELGVDRSPRVRSGQIDEDIVEVEVDEDGGLRIFLGRLSDSRADRFADEPGDNQEIFPVAAVLYVRQMIALTLAAAQHAAYLGQWQLAVGATGIQGRLVYDLVQRGDRSPRYDAPDYRRATTASYIELVQQPGAVAERLIGRLPRSFGVHSVYDRALQDS